MTRHSITPHSIAATIALLVAFCSINGCENGIGSGGGGGGTEHGVIRVEASFGELGSSPGQFQYPRAMTVVPADNAGEVQYGPSLVVIDKTARVQRFDASTGEFVAGFKMPEWDLGKPTGLSVGPHPKDPSRLLLWVADTHYHRVLAFDVPKPTRPGEKSIGDTVEPVFSFGSYGTAPGQFIYPTDVEVITDSSGAMDRVLVSEYGGNDRITVFTVSDADEIELVPAGTIGRFGNAGEDDTGQNQGELVLHRPQDMEYDASRGQLLIADALNHRIVRVWLDADRFGTVAGVFGGPGKVGRALGELDHPYSLAVLADGSVLVSEFGACRVQRLNLETGKSLGSYGVPGRRVGELVNPWEIVVIGKRAWVLDSGNNRVVGFHSPKPEPKITGGAG